MPEQQSRELARPPSSQDASRSNGQLGLRDKLIKPAVASSPAAQAQDGARELVETVVFVVVLVLLLKSFVAEAFVIPTGSMATTLWGYQSVVECPQCHFTFPTNANDQVENGMMVTGCTCPNCRFQIDFPAKHRRTEQRPDGDVEVQDERVPAATGDRVLVSKYLYDSNIALPRRLDVVVFKYPKAPQQNFVQMNYIKRLIGLPGETIGIHFGKLYVLKADQSPIYESDDSMRPEDRWQASAMHENSAVDLLTREDTPFKIIRKPPDKILSMRRIVYDHDFPAPGLPERWAPGDASIGWQSATDNDRGFKHSGREGQEIDWLRYRNIVRGSSDPELITDFLGYNTTTFTDHGHVPVGRNWVGDLMLDCEVVIDKPAGELVLELSKGVDRFRARWDLSTAHCRLFRITGDHEESLAEAVTGLKPGAAHRVRFANIDDRLVVWVDSQLPFGDGAIYPAAMAHGPYPNDLQPASVGLSAAAEGSIHHLQVWRDTYYTLQPGSSPGEADYAAVFPRDSGEDTLRDFNQSESWRNPASWAPLRQLPAKTLYVQPGHYLCLGDNSPHSSDGRSWGLVPERLLLGRALLVYYPFRFPYWPAYAPVNRVGAIR